MLIPAFWFFQSILDLLSGQPEFVASSAALPFSGELPQTFEIKPLTGPHINVWSHFRLNTRLVQDPDLDTNTTTVQALHQASNIQKTDAKLSWFTILYNWIRICVLSTLSVDMPLTNLRLRLRYRSSLQSPLSYRDNHPITTSKTNR